MPPRTLPLLIALAFLIGLSPTRAYASDTVSARNAAASSTTQDEEDEESAEQVPSEEPKKEEPPKKSQAELEAEDAARKQAVADQEKLAAQLARLETALGGNDPSVRMLREQLERASAGGEALGQGIVATAGVADSVLGAFGLPSGMTGAAEAFAAKLPGMAEHAKKIELVQTLDSLYADPDIRKAIEEGSGRSIDWENFDPLKNLKSADAGWGGVDLTKIEQEGQLSNISLLAEALRSGSTVKPIMIGGQLQGWDITAQDGTGGVSTWANTSLGPDTPSVTETAGNNAIENGAGQNGGNPGEVYGPPCPPSICPGDGPKVAANGNSEPGGEKSGPGDFSANSMIPADTDKGRQDQAEDIARQMRDNPAQDDTDSPPGPDDDGGFQTAMHTGDPSEHPAFGKGQDATFSADADANKQVLDMYRKTAEAPMTTASLLNFNPDETVASAVGKVKGALNGLRSVLMDLQSPQPGPDGEKTKGLAYTGDRNDRDEIYASTNNCKGNNTLLTGAQNCSPS